MISLQVSEQTTTGPVVAGTIEFHQNGLGSLRLSNTGAAGDRLEMAWQEITKLEDIPMTGTRTINRDGEEIRAYGEYTVAPGDETFPYAVYDYLERKYGFFVEVMD